MKGDIIQLTPREWEERISEVMQSSRQAALQEVAEWLLTDCKHGNLVATCFLCLQNLIDSLRKGVLLK